MQKPTSFAVDSYDSMCAVCVLVIINFFSSFEQ